LQLVETRYSVIGICGDEPSFSNKLFKFLKNFILALYKLHLKVVVAGIHTVNTQILYFRTPVNSNTIEIHVTGISIKFMSLVLVLNRFPIRIHIFFFTLIVISNQSRVNWNSSVFVVDRNILSPNIHFGYWYQYTSGKTVQSKQRRYCRVTIMSPASQTMTKITIKDPN